MASMHCSLRSAPSVRQVQRKCHKATMPCIHIFLFVIDSHFISHVCVCACVKFIGKLIEHFKHDTIDLQHSAPTFNTARRTSPTSLKNEVDNLLSVYTQCFLMQWIVDLFLVVISLYEQHKFDFYQRIISFLQKIHIVLYEIWKIMYYKSTVSVFRLTWSLYQLGLYLLSFAE